MPSNIAAWLPAQRVRPLEVKSAPYTHPDENEIVIKNGAVALNSVDYKRQELGDLLFSWTTYPCVLGSDVSGEVVEVGSGVSRFKVGDRVAGVGVALTSNKPFHGAFQAYTVLPTVLVSPIPSNLSYESASVLPLALSTAACGLFQKEFLALQFPSFPAKPMTGETVLVWGGSTSVGSNAMQLAVAAGYEVIATASPKNFDYVKKLGASEVFDYRSESAVSDLINAFKGRTSAGAVSIGDGAESACAKVLEKSSGKKFIAMISRPGKEPLPDNIGTKFVFGSDLKDNEVGPAIWTDFLPEALREGAYVAAPDAEVVGKGLESVQSGLDLLGKGVSAKKYVVSL